MAGFIQSGRFGAGVSYAAWDTSYATNQTYSNSNRTLTRVTANSWAHGSRSTTSKSSGLFYIEFSSNDTNNMFGVGNTSHSLANYPGQDLNSIGYNQATPGWYSNSISTAMDISFTTADRLCMAIDVTNKRIWWRTNSGNWNASGTASPAAGTGAVTWAFSGDVYIQGDAWPSTAAITMYPDPATWLHSAPSGFGAWTL